MPRKTEGLIIFGIILLLLLTVLDAVATQGSPQNFKTTAAIEPLVELMIDPKKPRTSSAGETWVNLLVYPHGQQIDVAEVLLNFDSDKMEVLKTIPGVFSSYGTPQTLNQGIKIVAFNDPSALGQLEKAAVLDFATLLLKVKGGPRGVIPLNFSSNTKVLEGGVNVLKSSQGASLQ